ARLNEYLVKAKNAEPRLMPLTFNSGPTGNPKAFTIMRGPHCEPAGSKKRMLFVHGTFSKTDAFFDGIRNAPGGPPFLEKLFDSYDEVLGYDHATLSVSPVLNAFDLARLMAKAQGPLDVIAHSRGGLVARWALEGFGLGKAAPVRGILVGCPINGTSLASPPRL